LFTLAGIAVYFAAIGLAAVRLALRLGAPARHWNQQILWYSAEATLLGVLLIAADLALMLPRKRRGERWVEPTPLSITGVTVVLTAYNDEESIAQAVQDFRGHRLVKRVIVVSNNSTDGTAERAAEAGALVINELQPGYGRCVYRCFEEALRFDDAECIVLCEGDCTFRGQDIDKLLAYLPHAEIVNGTRIVEQLRAYKTQLSTFMYYGNFFVGKLLELKHLGRGTLTDVGTTYKALRPDALRRLMPYLNPAVNLEFNAHFLDVALANRFVLVECPITFHSRVGASKGGNTNNLRALAVGLRMLRGISFGWPSARERRTREAAGNAQ
jgi:glycosyltransferase involved in cell wall biosynthesis